MTSEMVHVTDERPLPVVASPADQLAAAKQVSAQMLAVIRDSKTMSLNIRGREYLTAPAWATLAGMTGHSTRVVSVETIESGERDDDKDMPLYAYLATVELIDADGVVVGVGTGMAGTDEGPSLGQKGYGRMHAAAAFATTRATNRAIRSKLGWILALGGIELASAEEMPRPQAAQKTRPPGSNHIPANRPQAATPRPPQTNQRPPTPARAESPDDAPKAAPKPTASATPEELTAKMQEAKASDDMEAGSKLLALGRQFGYAYDSATGAFTAAE